MRRQVAISGTQGCQTIRHQKEVFRFIVQYAQPIVVEFQRRTCVRKPDEDVGRQIDGIEFDMRDGVQQCDTPRQRLRLAAPRHVARQK